MRVFSTGRFGLRRHMGSTFVKCLSKSFDFFENYPGHERARRGSSGHETSGKMIAVAFSRLHFLMVRGRKNQKSYKKTWVKFRRVV